MTFEPVQIADKDDAEGILHAIQQPVTYPPQKEKVVLPLLKRLPFLSRFAKRAGEAGNEALQLSASISALHGAPPAAVSTGFQFGGVSLAAVDFLLIPAIYLAAYILKQPVPMTLNNNARWLYSAVLLGLAIAAVAVSGAAPIIALVSGGLALGFSAFLLGKALYERYTLGKERKVVRQEMARDQEGMQQIQRAAETLHAQLQQTTDPEALAGIYQQIAGLQTRYHEQKERIMALKEKEDVLDEKIKKLGIVHIIDKGLAVSFAAVAVVGLAVTLFFPPVGLAILAGVSVAGLAYLTVRITVPIVRALGTWLLDKFRNASGAEPEVQNNNVPQLASQQEHQPEQERRVVATHSVHEAPTAGEDAKRTTEAVPGAVLPLHLHAESAQHEANSTEAMLELLGDKHEILAASAPQNTPNAEAEPLLGSVATRTAAPDEEHLDTDVETVDEGEGEGEGEQEESKVGLSH